MQRYLLVFIILFSMLYGNTQSYTPLLSETKTWDVFSWHSQEFAYWTGGGRLSFAGDTLINGQVYQIAMGNGYSAYEDPVFDEPFVRSATAHIAGFMREDLSEKKVYALDNDGVEYLIYDFSLLPGDTLQVDYVEGEDLSFRLDTIVDIVLPNGEPSREFVFYPATGFWFPEIDPVVITEGLGSRISLFFPFVHGSFEGGSVVSCIQENNVSLYSDLGAFGCDFVIVGNRDVIADNKLSLFPNPATSLLHIQAQAPIESIQVLSVDGRSLMRFQWDDSGNELDISALKTGVYVLKVLYADGKIQLEKLLIVD